jgi:hypothetical protein
MTHGDRLSRHRRTTRVGSGGRDQRMRGKWGSGLDLFVSIYPYICYEKRRTEEEIEVVDSPESELETSKLGDVFLGVEGVPELNYY